MASQKVAIITGAGKDMPFRFSSYPMLISVIATGMGNGVAVDLAQKGWKVAILDYNEVDGKTAADAIDGDFFKVDVRSWKDQYMAFETVFSKYGRVDFG